MKLHEGNRPSRASAVSFLPTPPSELPPFIFEWSLCLLARVTLHWLLLRSSVPRLFAPICAVRALAISDSGRWLNRDVASVTGTDWHHGHVHTHTRASTVYLRVVHKNNKKVASHMSSFVFWSRIDPLLPSICIGHTERGGLSFARF